MKPICSLLLKAKGQTSSLKADPLTSISFHYLKMQLRWKPELKFTSNVISPKMSTT